MKNKVTDSELGEIYCASDMFGRIKKIEIEGTPPVKKGKAYEYTSSDGVKLYFGLESGIFKGAVLNYNGRNIRLLPPLTGPEIALAVSGAVLLALFIVNSIWLCAYIPVQTFNPLTVGIITTFALADVELGVAGEIFACVFIFLSFILSILVDIAVVMAFVSAYIVLSRKVKHWIPKILIFLLLLAIGAAVLCALFWLMCLICNLISYIAS